MPAKSTGHRQAEETHKALVGRDGAFTGQQRVKKT